MLGSATHGLDPHPELAFPEHSHHLETLDRGIGRLGDASLDALHPLRARAHRLEAEGRLDQALQLAAVALEAVIEILHLLVPGFFRQQPLLLQLGNRLTIGRVLVGVDDVRRPVARAPQRLD
jgi:hypothetical protein